MSNQILSAIINGLRVDLPNELRAAAIIALLNSLDFTTNNFNIDDERNAIMKAVCETTQCAVVEVRIKAFECFARIADLYYDKLPAYISTIFQLTTAAIKSDDSSVGQQAVEVWVTLCECEIALMDDINAGIVGDDGQPPLLLNIVEQAAPALIPFLLEAMTKQSEDIDDADEWNVALAAAECLDFIANTIGEKVVDMVIPFVSANVTNADWRFKDAALTAFGSIADGATITSSEDGGKMGPIVKQATPVIIACLQDASPLVRETAAWTLGRLNEFHSDAIPPELVLPMVGALAVALEDRYPKVASRACFAIANIASAAEAQRDEATNAISQFLPGILQKLFLLANRPDGEEENLRLSAFEAVSLLVQNSAEDMRAVVAQVLAESLTRLEQANAPTFNPKDRVDTQSILCGVIGECLQRFSTAEAAPHTDRCVQLLLQVLSGRGAAAHEDAFMAIGHVAGKVEADFIRYAPFVVPPLLAGLRNIEEYSVCATAVGLVGDMARALGKTVAPFCDDIVRSLLDLLQSPDLHKSVKPQVISTFADIALATEDQFEKYAAVVLAILQQASAVTVDPDSEDDDIVEYVNSLHVSIIEAYSGILQVSGQYTLVYNISFLTISLFSFRFVHRVSKKEANKMLC